MDRTSSGASHLPRRNRPARCAQRRGASFIEFLGCVTALLGGVVLGALYLGIDLKSTGLCVLARAGVIQAAPSDKSQAAQTAATDATTNCPLAMASAAGGSSVPANNPSSQLATFSANGSDAPSAPATPATEFQSATESDPATGSAATAETHAPLSAVGDLTQSVKAALEAELAKEKAEEVTPEEEVRLTNAYWETLCNTIREEAERRQPTRIEEADLQLFEFLEFRENGHAAAAEKLATLSLRGVDLHVANYALKVRKWHESGANLYRRARLLLTDAPSSQNSGPLAQRWRSAATQHRMEEKLLMEKHLAVAAHLAHSQETADQSRGAAHTNAGAPSGSK